MAYRHLTQSERYQIYAFRKADFSIRHTAAELGRSPSTISRERGRNRSRRGYRPGKAQQLARHRACKCRCRIRITAVQWRAIAALLNKQWSPQQIAERARLEDTLRISHAWIYGFVAADRATGGKFWRQLRRATMRRRRYHKPRQRREVIRFRVRIEQRPVHVETREQLGHWEGDTIMGPLRIGAALTLVERKSRYLRIGALPNFQASTVVDIIGKRLSYIRARVDSITFDNGIEFAYHARIARLLQTNVYFAEPYKPWQRGSNENTNGLIRQYLPNTIKQFHRYVASVGFDSITLLVCYSQLLNRSIGSQLLSIGRHRRSRMIVLWRSVLLIITGCSIVFWPPVRAVGQDVMDHVDMSSAEMTIPELTREELLSSLFRASMDDPIDLTSRRLSGLDLHDVDFKGANLRWARMNNTNLQGANLRNTVLDSAWLIDANLEGADLRGASLASTQMRRANLRDANLAGARIVANLQRADLRGADLSNANMGADMKNQSMGLMRTIVRMAKLDGADLRNANAMRMDAEFASLRGALLDNANFRGVKLTGADLTKASAAGMDISESDVSGTYLVQMIGREKIIGLDNVKNLAEAEME